MTIQDQITSTAQAYGVDPNLALEVARRESGFNQSAISSAGAIGVFQLMPATAAALGVNPYDLNGNIKGGILYISQMLAQFGGDISKALAAYNWGPGNVAAYGDSWAEHAPAETVNYVSSILGRLGTSVGDAGTSILQELGSLFSPSSSDGMDGSLSTPQDLVLAVGAIALVAIFFWSI